MDWITASFEWNGIQPDLEKNISHRQAERTLRSTMTCFSMEISSLGGSPDVSNVSNESWAHISSATKELFQQRNVLILGSSATEIERLVANASSRQILQESLQRYRCKKFLEIARRRSDLKKRRRSLCEYSTPPSCLVNEDRLSPLLLVR